MSLRIGHGIDAHRLGEGRPLMLGCVAVVHDRGLLGHSDGDVAAHALADATLGAAGLGTIGERFPSSDERWRNISGHDLLVAVAGAIRSAGASVSSAHVVVIAETPRLVSLLPAMGAALGDALGVGAGTVRVSATTTDGLGATGRGEGIAASAVVLLETAE